MEMNTCKKTITFIVLAISTQFVFARNIKDVQPMFTSIGDIPVSVARIDYSVEKTSVYFITKKNFGGSFKLNHNIYIVGDNGERHHAIRSNGVDFDSLYVLCKGQRIKFSIDFEPTDVDNIALDVCSPNEFALYGLHDIKNPISVPRSDYSVSNPEDITENYQDGVVEIDGVLHAEDVSGQTVFADYHPYRPVNYDLSSQYATCDANGHFHMEFRINAPQWIQFLTHITGTVISGRLMVRPGDKLNVQLYGQEERMAVRYTNQSEHEYSRLFNAPRSIYDPRPFQNNINEHFRKMTYPQHMQNLMVEYHRMERFSDYVCWHYQLSPVESMYYNQYIRNRLLWTFFISDQALQTQMLETQSDEEHEKYEKWFALRKFEYLGLINPNNTSMLMMPLSNTPGVLVSLKPFCDCFESVPIDTPDRWIRIIEQQMNLLQDMTGWSRESFFMEGIIVSGVISYWQNNGHEFDADQVTKVKNMIHHPYNRMCFDMLCNEYANK